MVEVSRIERAMRNPKFLERIFTESERREPLTPQRVAGRWAAKEAVAKAVGTFLKWHDVEVFNMASGAPAVRIAQLAFDMTGRAVHVSLSHVKDNAVAVAILEAVSCAPDSNTGKT